MTELVRIRAPNPSRAEPAMNLPGADGIRWYLAP
jgi:hypothetical protein